MIPLYALLVLSLVLFGIGWMGLVVRRNLLILFMSIEIMMNAVNLAFVSVARYRLDMNGQVVALFVMAVAACEAVVGLAIAIALFHHHKTVDVDRFSDLRG